MLNAVLFRFDSYLDYVELPMHLSFRVIRITSFDLAINCSDKMISPIALNDGKSVYLCG